MTLRILTYIFQILAVILLPWWLALVAAVIFSFFFWPYPEILFTGILLDLLYGFTGAPPFGIRFQFSFFCILFIFILYVLVRRGLRVKPGNFA